MTAMTAAAAGLMSCHHCGLLCRDPGHVDGQVLCPRCGGSVHGRKPNSVARTWAFLIAATILYIPANVYPIMSFKTLGQGDPQTILGGVEYLVHHGEYGVAFVIFFASIMVPSLKLIVLAYLLLSVQFKWSWRPRDRTALYRLTEIMGRWSMIDVFVVAILVSLVQLGSVASVEPKLGAAAFAAVVILTMFGAMAFDPRLMWDVLEERQ